MPKSALDKAREAPGSTKARILTAAEAIFAERGFEGASTREIAAQAGVNISSLHYHWASKEALYLAVFRSVYDDIVALLGRALSGLDPAHADLRAVIDEVMTLLYDHFADHPNVPKLVMRRVLDGDEGDAAVQRDVLLPAWAVFDEWLGRMGRRRSETDSRLFMLSVHSVMLVYLLDSPSYRSLLGGSVRQSPLREQVRAHIARLVHALLAA